MLTCKPQISTFNLINNFEVSSRFNTRARYFISLPFGITTVSMKPANRTFIISGGCSGLGLATARNLHQDGAYVALLDINAEAGERTEKEFGSRAKFFEVDVRDSDSIAKAVKGTAEWVKQTGKEIGGVIAAAGVGLPAKVCAYRVQEIG
jgi:NAD(P)-dependent dehydrogenase (short-subunit alcohol dehydrogenase family)